MKSCPVSSPDLPEVSSCGSSTLPSSGSQSFDMALKEAELENRSPQSEAGFPVYSPDTPPSAIPALSSPEFLKTPPPKSLDVAAAYQRQAEQTDGAAHLSGFQKYKDDQLLRNPGGRNYYLDEKKVLEPSLEQSLWALIRKDFSDAFRKYQEFFRQHVSGDHRFFTGTRKMKSSRDNKRGLLRTMGDFCRDLGERLEFRRMASGLRAGPPQGFKARFLYSVSKLKDAFIGDILTGVPSSRRTTWPRTCILSGLAPG